MGILAENRKARYEYAFLEKFEAGIVLSGQEVKSIKNGRINLAGSFVIAQNNEAFLIGADIPPYQPKNSPTAYNPKRSRKLLLTRKEIKFLLGKTQEKGLTLVPIRVYTKGRLIKLEFVLAKGKHQADKRETIRKKETEKRIERALKRR